jgi:small-conductance mechanosensitive channel
MNESVVPMLEEAAESQALGAADLASETVNQMQNFFYLDKLISYASEPQNIIKFATGIISILIFWGIYQLVRLIIKKTTVKKFDPRVSKSIMRILSYIFYVLIVMYVMGLLGIDLAAIWGAMGIAGVAIGFAAQTTVSNLISGIFIVTEKAIKFGDFIELDGVSGTVERIGLLSIRVKTLDNQLIRIPSSSVINAKLKNFSTYDYRRYVFEVSVDYSTDLDKALEVLKGVPAKCSLAITDKPDYAPKAILTTCMDSGIGMNLVVWCERPNFLDLKSQVCKEVVKAFQENDINIPFNRLDVSMLTDKTVPALSFKTES